MKLMVRGAPRMVGQVLLSVGALLGVLMLLGSIAAPLLGARPVVITSGSMAPAIPTGSLTLTHEIPAGEANVGDVVMVTAASGSRVTHRVISTSGSGDQVALQLQGDANAVPDPETYVVSRVDRVVLDVPWVGYLFSALRTPVGLFGLGALATVLVVLIASGGSSGPKSGQNQPDRPDRHVGRRRSSAPPASRGGVTALAVCVATSLGVCSTDASRAAWVDPVSVNGSTLDAHTVQRPDSVSCSVSGSTVTFAWPEKDVRYDYEIVLWRTGSPDAVQSTNQVTAAAVSRQFTSPGAFGLSGSLLGISQSFYFYAEVRSWLASTSAPNRWQSIDVRRSTQRVRIDVDCLIILLCSVSAPSCVV